MNEPVEYDAEQADSEADTTPDDVVVVEKPIEEPVVKKDGPDTTMIKIADSLKMLQKESSDDKLYETMSAIVPGIPRAIAVYSDANGVKYTVMSIPVAEKTTIICIGASAKSSNQEISASTSCVLVPIGIEDIRGYMDEYSRKNSPDMYKLVSRIRDEVSDECVRRVNTASVPVSDSQAKRRGRPRKQ